MIRTWEIQAAEKLAGKGPFLTHPLGGAPREPTEKALLLQKYA